MFSYKSVGGECLSSSVSFYKTKKIVYVFFILLAIIIIALIYFQDKKINLVLKQDEIVTVITAPNYNEVEYLSSNIEVEKLIDYLNALEYKRVLMNNSKGWQIYIKSRSYSITIQSPYIQINGFWYKSKGLTLDAISNFYNTQD